MRTACRAAANWLCLGKAVDERPGGLDKHAHLATATIPAASVVAAAAAIAMTSANSGVAAAAATAMSAANLPAAAAAAVDVVVAAVVAPAVAADLRGDLRNCSY
jgi:hypothetical protein